MGWGGSGKNLPSVRILSGCLKNVCCALDQAYTAWQDMSDIEVRPPQNTLTAIARSGKHECRSLAVGCVT